MTTGNLENMPFVYYFGAEIASRYYFIATFIDDHIKHHSEALHGIPRP
jgi:hypothetical protein